MSVPCCLGCSGRLATAQQRSGRCVMRSRRQRRDGLYPLPRALCSQCWVPPAAVLLAANSDMSLWAFEKLASTSMGVIAIEHREVPCYYKPNKPARNPNGQRSGAERGPPGNWNPAMDKRPFKQVGYNNGRRLRGITSN